MTTIEKAARMALEALEQHLTHHEHGCVYLDPAVTALRQALEQPVREWVGLTDEEVRAAYCTISDKEWAIGGMSDAEPFARAIEAALKTKNT